MVSLVVVGACYLDTILTVPYYPHEDEKLRAESLSKRRGGNGPNTLELLAQLITARHRLEALSLLLCSVLPSESSPAVNLIKTSLGPAVDLSTCIYREGLTEAASSYIIQSVGSGSRTLVNYNDLPEMTLEEFEHVSEGVGSTDKWYHFEGRIPDVTLGCIRHLRRKSPDITVSVEVEKPGRAGLEELAAEADVVFYSQSWAKVFKGFLASASLAHGLLVEGLQDTGRMSSCTGSGSPEGVSLALELGYDYSKTDAFRSLLFCTWGGDGSAAWCRSTGDLAEAPAFKLEGKPLIDSTGAGDAFIAGILFALLVGGVDGNHHSIAQGSPLASLPDMLEFANEVAGRKVVQHGFNGIGEALDNCIYVGSLS